MAVVQEQLVNGAVEIKTYNLLQESFQECVRKLEQSFGATHAWFRYVIPHIVPSACFDTAVATTLPSERLGRLAELVKDLDSFAQRTGSFHTILPMTHAIKLFHW